MYTMIYFLIYGVGCFLLMLFSRAIGPKPSFIVYATSYKIGGAAVTLLVLFLLFGGLVALFGGMTWSTYWWVIKVGFGIIIHLAFISLIFKYGLMR